MVITFLIFVIACRQSVCSTRSGWRRGWDSSYIQVGVGGDGGGDDGDDGDYGDDGDDDDWCVIDQDLGKKWDGCFYQGDDQPYSPVIQEDGDNNAFSSCKSI